MATPIFVVSCSIIAPCLRWATRRRLAMLFVSELIVRDRRLQQPSHFCVIMTSCRILDRSLSPLCLHSLSQMCPLCLHSPSQISRAREIAPAPSSRESVFLE